MARDTERVDTIPADDEVSLFELGTSLLRHRWAIARWMVALTVLAGVWVLFSKPSYTASATFIPKPSDSGQRSGLASLAGQFGIQIGAAETQTNSPDFYADLLTSRAILAPIVADTFSVAETARSHAPLLDLLKVKPANPARRLELGVEKLRGLERTSITVKTGVVELSVSTPWPSLSLAVAQRQVAAVNEFNLNTRQSQASEERLFTETRLTEARTVLRAAEDKLQSFLERNRQFTQSPELKFEQDRLQREIDLDQQIVTSLAQAYEDVRIREVRNTPVITVIEPPTLPTVADPRRRVFRLLLGFVLGGLIGSGLAIVRDLAIRYRATGGSEAETFFRTLHDALHGAADWAGSRARPRDPG